MTTEEIAARFAAIDRQNAELLADIARPEFEGDIMLDPTLNRAQTYIHLANEAVVSFPQGAFPIALAADAVASTDRLLAACATRYGRLAVKPMSQAFHALENLWNYSGPPTHPPAVFPKKVFAAEEKLLSAICTFNQQILAQSHPNPASSPLSPISPLSPSPPAVSVADAAASLGVSANTIRNWDAHGCPADPSYPGRFNAAVFYQWAVTYRSKRSFRREARKRAILLNSSRFSN